MAMLVRAKELAAQEGDHTPDVGDYDDDDGIIENNDSDDDGDDDGGDDDDDDHLILCQSCQELRNLRLKQQLNGVLQPEL